VLVFGWRGSQNLGLRLEKWLLCVGLPPVAVTLVGCVSTWRSGLSPTTFTGSASADSSSMSLPMLRKWAVTVTVTSSSSASVTVQDGETVGGGYCGGAAARRVVSGLCV